MPVIMAAKSSSGRLGCVVVRPDAGKFLLLGATSMEVLQVPLVLALMVLALMALALTLAQTDEKDQQQGARST